MNIKFLFIYIRFLHFARRKLQSSIPNGSLIVYLFLNLKENSLGNARQWRKVC